MPVARSGQPSPFRSPETIRVLLVGNCTSILPAKDPLFLSEQGADPVADLASIRADYNLRVSPASIPSSHGETALLRSHSPHCRFRSYRQLHGMSFPRGPRAIRVHHLDLPVPVGKAP